VICHQTIRGATFAALVLSTAFADNRPNILYVALEDITPMMGCYGDEYAKTPVFDQLAAEGIRYTNAHSVAPVCSVSRSSIVTGMYPSTIGTLHHRSGGLPAPTFLKFVPNLMGEAGYFTTNQKSDYNIVGMKYDRQGKKVGNTPWRLRPNKSQPFFSKIDFGECHSSVTKTPEEVIIPKRLNRLQPDDFHDPAAAPLPSFHPDDSFFRRSWALAPAIKPLEIARRKFKAQGRYGHANKPLDRAYRALTGQQLYYRWGMGASGTPVSPLVSIQKKPFTLKKGIDEPRKK